MSFGFGGLDTVSGSTLDAAAFWVLLIEKHGQGQDAYMVGEPAARARR